MDVPNETIMNIAMAGTLRTDRFMSIREVFISVHLFEPKFPTGWSSCCISWCLSVSKKWPDATTPLKFTPIVAGQFACAGTDAKRSPRMRPAMAAV